MTAPQADLQTGYLDVSGLTDSEPYTESLAGTYSMADENAEPPAVTLFKYAGKNGEEYLFDKAGRLRGYSSGKATGAAAFTESLKSEEILRQTCDEVLASYIDDYAEYTEIQSQYYDNDSVTYNLAMQHQTADGISDFALIRLNEAGEVHDISISYADADGDCANKNFVTDEDKAGFEKQAEPFLQALADYSAEVKYRQYKHVNGKLYAYYEFSYMDPNTGLATGSKLLIFVR